MSPRLQIVRGSLGRSPLRPSLALRVHPLSKSDCRVCLHPMSVRAKKECVYESNTFPYMHVNLGKWWVTVSIFKYCISCINIGSLQQSYSYSRQDSSLWYIVILNMLHDVDIYAIRYTAEKSVTFCKRTKLGWQKYTMKENGLACMEIKIEFNALFPL